MVLIFCAAVEVTRDVVRHRNVSIPTVVITYLILTMLFGMFLCYLLHCTLAYLTEQSWFGLRIPRHAPLHITTLSRPTGSLGMLLLPALPEQHSFFLRWTVTALVWALVVLLTNDFKGPGVSLAYALRTNASFWMICVITGAIISSWTRLRKVNVRSVVLSNHAIRLYFDYVTPKTGHFVRISKSPLMEWHSFAT